MKVIVKNFKELLNGKIKPVVGFVKSSELTEPVMKLTAKKDKIFIECSSSNREVLVNAEAKVKKKGEVYLLSSALTDLKSTHKKATIEALKKKMVIKSGEKDRKMILNIDTTSKKNYVSIKGIKKKSEFKTKISLPMLQKAIGRISIRPIVVPGIPNALITLMSEGKTFRAIVQDSLRVLTLEIPKSKIKIKGELVTDFLELQNVLTVVSSMADDASFSFSKKHLLAKGYDGEDEEIINIMQNHSISGGNATAKAVIKMAKQAKTKMGFVPNESFIEVIENVIGLVNSRSKQGHVDITIKKDKTILVEGAGASTVYKETLKVSKVMGSGTVRIKSNVLGDVIRIIAPKAIIKVTDNSFLITNKWKDMETNFILPFLSVKK